MIEVNRDWIRLLSGYYPIAFICQSLIRGYVNLSTMRDCIVFTHMVQWELQIDLLVVNEICLWFFDAGFGVVLRGAGA